MFTVPKPVVPDDGLGSSVHERYVPHQATLLGENRSPLLFPHKASSLGGVDGTALTFGTMPAPTSVPALTPSPNEMPGDEMQRRQPDAQPLDRLWKMTKAYLPKSSFLLLLSLLYHFSLLFFFVRLTF